MAKRKAAKKAKKKSGDRIVLMPVRLSAADLKRLGVFAKNDTTVTSCTHSVSGSHWACTGLVGFGGRGRLTKVSR